MEEILQSSWYGKYPIIYRVSYISGGTGFQPSTVVSVFEIAKTRSVRKWRILYWGGRKTSSFLDFFGKNIFFHITYKTFKMPYKSISILFPLQLDQIQHSQLVGSRILKPMVSWKIEPASLNANTKKNWIPENCMENVDWLWTSFPCYRRLIHWPFFVSHPVLPSPNSGLNRFTCITCTLPESQRKFTVERQILKS